VVLLILPEHYGAADRGDGGPARMCQSFACPSARWLCPARTTGRPHRSASMPRAAPTLMWHRAPALPVEAAPAGRSCPGAAHDGVSQPDPGLLAHRPPELLGVSRHGHVGLPPAPPAHNMFTTFLIRRSLS